MSITYSECVFEAVVIQHAVGTRRVVICPAVQYFSTFSHKRHDFRGGKIYWKYILLYLFINSNWVVTRWQWLFYIYTKYEIGYC